MKSSKSVLVKVVLFLVRSTKTCLEPSMAKILPVMVIGLSFEVYNSFLPQLAKKLRAVEVQSPENMPGKGAFYYINHHNSGTFLDFKIQQLPILRPVEVGKSYIPQKKALYHVV